MAYGTPSGPGDVEAYYTHIRHGRPPPPELLEDLQARYRAIGGTSPLRDITVAQAQGIAGRIANTTAYVGYKHCAPFIEDAVADLVRDQIEAAVGIVMAPHYSAMSIGEYAARARRAADRAGWDGRLEIVKSWHTEPAFVSLLAKRTTEALRSLPPDARMAPVVIFSAHSLPEKIVQAGDPYPWQLQETARAVADAAGIDRWTVAWQSAGRTDAKWLQPDLADVIRSEVRSGATAIVVCPCGFVADHLEVLYDVDIEARAVARETGTPLVRTRSPNADAEFLDTVAGVVERALRSIHVPTP